jgi:hypothetical protein
MATNGKVVGGAISTTQNNSGQPYDSSFLSVDDIAAEAEVTSKTPFRRAIIGLGSNNIIDLLSNYKLNPNDDIREPPLAVEFICNGIPSVFATLGNFSTIIGKAKSRKTFLISLIVAALLRDDILMDKIQGHLKPGKKKIVVFDTEQSSYHALIVLKRILNTAGVDFETVNLEYYCLRTFDTKSRRELIEHKLNNDPSIGLAVIDGIRDLVSDINSPEEATLITNLLLKWTEERNIHIITVLHQNKADNNARGHVGTELINKSESVLSVTKDADNNERSIVSPEYFRGMEFKPFTFGVNEHGLPYVIENWEPKVEGNGKRRALLPHQLPQLQHCEILREIFSHECRPKYADLETQIKLKFQKYGIEFGQSKATEFLKYYKNEGWVKENKEKLPGEKTTTYYFAQPL